MDTKKCPYCGEDIMVTAKKCKHCGEWLDKTAPQAQPIPVIEAKSSVPESDEDNGCLAGLIGWGIFICIILFVFHLTVPSNERMSKCVLDEAVSEVQSQAGDISSLFGSEAKLLVSLLASTDEAEDGIRKSILKYNQIEIEEGYFWTNAYLHNVDHDAVGEHVGIGFLGITIPLVLWDDLKMSGDEYYWYGGSEE